MAYVCNNCGEELVAWAGKCPQCSSWGTIVKFNDGGSGSGILKTSSSSRSRSKGSDLIKAADKLIVSKDRDRGAVARMKSGYEEFDRVMGGGMFPGEAILMSGQPGIGKSTLLLQIVYNISRKGKVIYISGEESLGQVQDRFYRIAGVNKNKPIEAASRENLLFSSETNVENIAALIEEADPILVIVDSIQTVESENHPSFPGSISQVKICGATLTRLAKLHSIPIIMIGQINKQGMIAGPKILEHLVDCVISFEGDEQNQFRILRCIKNRFGSINEIGVFSMGPRGLEQVQNPSSVFLDGEGGVAGSSIGVVQKGSRVIFLEVQALVIKRDSDGAPLKRVGNGIKKNRIDMLCAILSKRGSVFLGDKDVFLNIVGGMDVSDPMIDLAICASIHSAVSEKPVSRDTVYVGEVGLTGSVKTPWEISRLAREAKRVGYKKVITGSTSGKNAAETIVGIRDIASLKRYL